MEVLGEAIQVGLLLRLREWDGMRSQEFQVNISDLWGPTLSCCGFVKSRKKLLFLPLKATWQRQLYGQQHVLLGFEHEMSGAGPEGPGTFRIHLMAGGHYTLGELLDEELHSAVWQLQALVVSESPYAAQLVEAYGSVEPWRPDLPPEDVWCVYQTRRHLELWTAALTKAMPRWFRRLHRPELDALADEVSMCLEPGK